MQRKFLFPPITPHTDKQQRNALHNAAEPVETLLNTHKKKVEGALEF